MQKPDRSVFILFLCFLFHPEDSSAAATSPGRRRQFARFDNRLAGTLKIAFWVAAVILFWTGIPVICCSIRHFF